MSNIDRSQIGREARARFQDNAAVRRLEQGQK
jgi:hypothetical protein